MMDCIQDKLASSLFYDKRDNQLDTEHINWLNYQYKFRMHRQFDIDY